MFFQLMRAQYSGSEIAGTTGDVNPVKAVIYATGYSRKMSGR